MGKKKERRQKAQKVQRNVLGLLNDGEKATGRSDAQQNSVICSPASMMPEEEEKTQKVRPRV